MNPLIYGKNAVQRIVSIEPGDATAEVFRELEDGTVVSETVPNSHYILFDRQHSPKMKRLKGDQFYNHIMEYDNREKFQEVLSASYKKELPLHVIRDPKEALMCKDGLTYFKGMKVEDVSVLSFDIETTGLTHDKDSRVLLISNTFRRKGKIERKLFALDNYVTQPQLINQWAKWVREINPSVIVGHNIFGFDLPYINHCLTVEPWPEKGTLNLGRDGSPIKFATRTSQFRKDGSQAYDYTNAWIYGREIVDTWFLSMKYDTAARREYESYGLKAVIKHEGLERKGRQHYEAGDIAKNWSNPKEREKIKAYAIDDADDALKLYDLMVPSLFYYTQSVPRSLQAVVNSATGSQINSLMVRAYLQQGHSIAQGSEAADFEGGISMGVPGIHRNVWKVDVSSMYPSIMLQHRIHSNDKDPLGYTTQILEWLTKERLNNKKLAKETGDAYYGALSDSQKIVCNSFFGFMGAPKLNYNYPQGAAEITKNGRRILQDAIQWSERKGFILCNADTDSISIKKSDEKPFTPEERSTLLAELNARQDALIRWEDDGHFRKFIICAAKNYVLDDGKKVKIKGNSLKATKKEPRLREFINEVIDLLLKDRKEQIIFAYLGVVREILNLKDIAPWCFKATVTKNVLKDDATVFNTKIRTALGKKAVSEGDKVYLFYKEDGSLCLRENFAGECDKSVLMGKLRDTLEAFGKVIDAELFPDFTLKRNKELLVELMPVPAPKDDWKEVACQNITNILKSPPIGVKVTRL